MLGTVAGVFVDRWDRCKTVIAANFMLAAGLLPLLAVRPAESIWIVYLVAFGQAVVSQFLFPAWSALLPVVVPPEDLVSANSLRSVGVSVARLVGPALGGVAAAAGSLGAAALIDSGSFLVVAIMAALVTGVATAVRTRPVVTEAAAFRVFYRELLEGFALLRGNRVVTTLVASNIVVSVGEGVFSVMFVVGRGVATPAPGSCGWRRPGEPGRIRAGWPPPGRC